MVFVKFILCQVKTPGILAALKYIITSIFLPVECHFVNLVKISKTTLKIKHGFQTLGALPPSSIQMMNYKQMGLIGFFLVIPLHKLILHHFWDERQPNAQANTSINLALIPMVRKL